jgi:hypothetical protein
MTFGVSRNDNIFRLLKSAFPDDKMVIKAHAAEGCTFVEQHQKR